MSSFGSAATRVVPAALGLLLLAGSPATAQPVALLETFFHAPGASDGLETAVDSVVSPDGTSVYVAGRRNDGIAVFARDPATGLLTPQAPALWTGAGGTIPDLDAPSALAISPDGAHLYVTASQSDAVVVLARDPATGALSFVESKKDGAAGQPLLGFLDNVGAIAVSSDGAHVYAGALNDSAITVFVRDELTGALTPVQNVVNGQGGVLGLQGPRDFAFTTGGEHLYVASVPDDAVAVFARNPANGTLGFVQRVANGVAGVSGLDNARDVAVTADGTSVYVAAGGEMANNPGTGALVTFDRDAGTGALSFVESLTAADLGVSQPNGLAITPDDGLVLMVSQGRQGAPIGGVANGFDGSLAVFTRDAATGLLNFEDLLRDSDDGSTGIDGLRGAFQVDLSPDGLHAYVAAEQDFLSTNPPVDPERGGAVSVFSVPEPGATSAALAALGALGALVRRRQLLI